MERVVFYVWKSWILIYFTLLGILLKITTLTFFGVPLQFIKTNLGMLSCYIVSTVWLAACPPRSPTSCLGKLHIQNQRRERIIRKWVYILVLVLESQVTRHPTWCTSVYARENG